MQKTFSAALSTVPISCFFLIRRAGLQCCVSTGFVLRRWSNLPRKQPLGGGDRKAQHVAEGGVLGRVGKEYESPRDDTG